MSLNWVLIRTRAGAALLASAIRWLAGGGGSLKVKTVRGGIWLTIGEGVSRLAGLIKIGVLGRLLAPADFGLLGIALLVQQSIEYFTQTGFSTALVQKREDIRPYLDTAWTVQVVRGGAIAAFIYAGAPLGAWFFENAAATDFIRAIAAVTLIGAFTNPAVIYLRKELDFARDLVWRQAGVVAGLAAGIGVAFWTRNAWALICSVIAARAAETAASYWAVRYRPRPAMDWRRARELMSFGKWIFWTNFLAFFELNLDSLVAGRVLGTAALGSYQVAGQVAMAPSVKLGTQAHGVLFPAFSKVEGMEQLRRGFQSALSLLAAVVLPISCLICLFPQIVIRVLLGSRWLSIGPLVQILACAGAVRAITGLTAPVFLALGQPKWQTRSIALRVVLAVALILPLTRALGLVGVALAMAVAAAISTAYQLRVVAALTQMRIRQFASPIATGLLGAAGVLLARLAAFVFPRFEWACAAVAAALFMALLVRSGRRLLLRKA